MEDQLTLFTQYESDYCNKSTDVARKIDSLAALVGDQRRKKVTEVEYDIKEAEQVIKRMEMEARSFAPDQAQRVQFKIQDYKRDLQGLKDQLKKSSRGQASSENTRKELGLETDYFSTTTSQRDTMLKATEKANTTTERLKYGRAQLVETEELGENVLEALAAQRASIERTTSRLENTHEELKGSQRILSKMNKRTKWLFWP